ncbi:MAG: hypothetical protein U1E26_09840, partial [Coriobacteriia bacterium]|nr:hypothetical protein [Coriobacteriia bacterium]
MSGSKDLGVEPEGATPLGPDELVGLIPTSVSNRSELNEVEQENIADATRWAFGQKWTAETLLSEQALRQLHKRMFGDVWKWAGTFMRIPVKPITCSTASRTAFRRKPDGLAPGGASYTQSDAVSGFRSTSAD